MKTYTLRELVRDHDVHSIKRVNSEASFLMGEIKNGSRQPWMKVITPQADGTTTERRVLWLELIPESTGWYIYERSKGGIVIVADPEAEVPAGEVIETQTAPPYVEGRLHCPACQVELHLGEPMHTCDAWIRYGQTLEAVARELKHQRYLINCAPRS